MRERTKRAHTHHALRGRTAPSHTHTVRIARPPCVVMHADTLEHDSHMRSPQPPHKIDPHQNSWSEASYSNTCPSHPTPEQPHHTHIDHNSLALSLIVATSPSRTNCAHCKHTPHTHTPEVLQHVGVCCIVNCLTSLVTPHKSKTKTKCGSGHARQLMSHTQYDCCFSQDE